MLIIWLQGIWLILHGYKYIDTPLWSGIYLLPLTVGFLDGRPALGLAVGPVRGPLCSPPAGCCVSAASFGGLLLIPTDFRYVGVRNAHLHGRRWAWACSPRPTRPRS